ncbi:unnamed protein product, partial [marine sediment metagenome]
ASQGYGFTGDEDTLTDGTRDFTCSDNIVYHSTGTPSGVAPVTSGVYLHNASRGLIQGNWILGVRNALGLWGLCQWNDFIDNYGRVRGVVSYEAIELGTVYQTNNRFRGNRIVGMSGAGQQFASIVGNYNDFDDSNSFELDGGTGDWDVVISGDYNKFRPRVFPSGAVVTDSGTGNNIGVGLRGLQALADGATISWDVSQRPTAEVTLGGNRTLALPTAAVVGETYRLLVRQDEVAARTLAFAVGYVFPAGAAPVITVTAGRADWLYVTAAGSGLF